ncbi:methyl-accepting chemotaxis sensory transducer with Cache sensor [Marinobacter daqiaonensis]|uniref:Methyl-accepting chemotaxis sensory transducer with Cache sensor n=1 Tax=Marinobacter daqiaonensis TaxID=650891 RepID=A0A1I6GYL7_9GAMM|nr:methyl-accepting chemotaxis protein [Marinobacter daqiaonensis]SFR47315.1 methyl-accepting chemotaxis sensory transducer with Cache sensor [Marinobacter daqiaonensis]
MRFLNQFTVRTRLLLAILVPVLLTAAAIAWITVSQIQAHGEDELKRLESSLTKANKAGLQNLVDAARAVVLEAKNDPALSQEEAKAEAAERLRSIRFDESNYVFAYTRDVYNLAYAPDPSKEGPTKNPVLKELVGALFAAAAGDGFYGYDWMNPASGNEEPKMSYATLIPDWDWMIGAGVYTTGIQQELLAARQEVKESVNAALGFIFLATVIVVVGSLLIGLFVGRTVTLPLKGISNMMQEIAAGEGDLRHRLPDEGNDELAELGRRFNAFVTKIQNTMREVGTTTDQVASAAEELSRVATETRVSVQEQGSETDQIASAIHEMATTIQQISGNAREVQNAASDADRMAREGGETISSAQGAVNRLSGEIEGSAGAITALAEKSDDIQQVLDVIHAVTEQTNLLALNAAIEAARAGEHGRGFSVVADEVRQLAKRSAESADRIREMINGFVSESRAAVDRMGDSRKSSEETVARINHATDALGTIETSVGQIHHQVTQIATAAEQQSQVAEEINQNVVRIVDAAQRSHGGVTQTNEASHELARLSENLRQLVGQFKV